MFKEFTLGERISLLRQAKDLTQKDLSKILNVSDKTISKWETSENEPSIADIQKLTEIFNVSLDLILKGNPIDAQDRLAIKIIQEKKEYNHAKEEINTFFKKYCPYKDMDSDDFFVIIDNKPFANLETVLICDNYDFYNKINERFTFVKFTNDDCDNARESKINTRLNNKPSVEYLPHPYSVKLADLKTCNSLEFFEYVINEMKEQNKKLDKQANKYYVPNKIDIKKELSNYLEHLEILDMEDDRVYEKIIFLIDNGAVFYNRIPYNSDSGGYYLEVDTAKTAMFYKVSVDMIKTKNELLEVKQERAKLKRKKQ